MYDHLLPPELPYKPNKPISKSKPYLLEYKHEQSDNDRLIPMYKIVDKICYIYNQIRKK